MTPEEKAIEDERRRKVHEESKKKFNELTGGMGKMMGGALSGLGSMFGGGKQKQEQ